MDAFASLLGGFQVALTPLNLVMAFIGVALGTAIGALPGIGPINAVALLLPLCFALKLPPETATVVGAITPCVPAFEKNTVYGATPPETVNVEEAALHAAPPTYVYAPGAMTSGAAGGATRDTDRP